MTGLVGTQVLITGLDNSCLPKGWSKCSLCGPGLNCAPCCFLLWQGSSELNAKSHNHCTLSSRDVQIFSSHHMATATARNQGGQVLAIQDCLSFPLQWLFSWYDVKTACCYHSPAFWFSWRCFLMWIVFQFGVPAGGQSVEGSVWPSCSTSPLYFVF